MSWLPSAKQGRLTSTRPWRPAALAGADTSDLRYVIIDEIVGRMVGLALSRWPQVDEQGRVRFPGRVRLLGADADLLRRYLRQHRLPRELADRSLRIGDTFAVRVRPNALGAVEDEDEEAELHRLEPALEPARWISPPVYDVTREARDAAKLTFYAAVSPTLDPDEASSLAPLTD